LWRANKKQGRVNGMGQDGAATTAAIPPKVIDSKAEEAGSRPAEIVGRYEAMALIALLRGITDGDRKSERLPGADPSRDS